MKLLPPSVFALRQETLLSDHAMPSSEVVVSGSPTGKIIAGAELEAAIQWHDFFLVFVTDDIPQEDTLRIYLFDRQLNLVDSATLGAIYSTGSFSELELGPPNTVRFRFIGGVTWTLELLTETTLALPFFSDPKGVHRPFKFARRFKLYGDPVPEADS